MRDCLILLLVLQHVVVLEAGQLQTLPEIEGEEMKIKVERCVKCKFHVKAGQLKILCLTYDIPVCRLRDNKMILNLDRRFPRWCPLLKEPVTVEKA